MRMPTHVSAILEKVTMAMVKDKIIDVLKTPRGEYQVKAVMSMFNAKRLTQIHADAFPHMMKMLDIILAYAKEDITVTFTGCDR